MLRILINNKYYLVKRDLTTFGKLSNLAVLRFETKHGFLTGICRDGCPEINSGQPFLAMTLAIKSGENS